VYAHGVLRHYRKQAGSTSEGTQQSAASNTEGGGQMAALGGSSPLVFGLCTPELYQWLFIGPWIVKDLFWTCGNLWGGLVSGFVVGVLFLDYLRRYGGLLHVAELCWLVGNCFAMVGELGYEERNRAVRVEAAAILGFGAAAVACALVWGAVFTDAKNDRVFYGRSLTRWFDIASALSAVVFIILIAVAISTLRTILDFIGAFAAAYISYVVPPLWVIQIRRRQPGFTWCSLEILGCVTVSALGAFLFVFGTYSALHDAELF
jgi:hypothetical protein